MKFTLVLTLSYIFSFCICIDSCDSSSKEITRAFDAEFDAIDEEVNSFDAKVRGRFKISSHQLDHFEEEYGSQFIETLIIPYVRSISRDILMNYSAAEIYNYNRNEIEQEVKDSLELELKSHKIDLTEFHLTSVKLPDKLYDRLVKEHIEKQKN